MSRSYKHSPVYTDGRNGQVISKRIANKTVRKYKHKIANGKAYKHLFELWNIHDFVIYWSWSEAIKDYKSNKYKNLNGLTLKDLYNHWNKFHRRK